MKLPKYTPSIPPILSKVSDPVDTYCCLQTNLSNKAAINGCNFLKDIAEIQNEIWDPRSFTSFGDYYASKPQFYRSDLKPDLGIPRAAPDLGIRRCQEQETTEF